MILKKVKRYIIAFLFTAPLLANRIFEMDLLTTCENICRYGDYNPKEKSKEVGHFLEAILRILSKTVSQEQVCQMWCDADLKWDMFLPISDVDSFIKENVSISSRIFTSQALNSPPEILCKS